MTGGTFLTSKDLMKHVEKEYDVLLLTAENDVLRLFNYNHGDFDLIKEYSRIKKWSAKNFHDSWLSYIYFDILINYNIDLVHIRHFINHSFDLPEISKKLDIPVVVSLHDFYLACPFYTLLDENNNYCGGKCKNNSLNCYNSLRSLNDINSKEMIGRWRDEVSHMMNFVDYIITTADFVKDLFFSVYPQMKYMNFEVIEHGRDFPELNKKYYELPSRDKPLKILCPANYLNEMKGSEFIKLLKKEDVNNRLEFHFLGHCRNGVEEYGINHGPFEREEYYKKVKEISPSFVGIFSIWPETFCHTLTEAWSCGIPVIGSNIGVIQDRILNSDGGWVLDIDNPKKSYKMILSIAENINEYMGIVENISNFSLKTTYKMSEEYLQIYNLLLKNNSLKSFFIDKNDVKKNKEIISESNFFDKNFYLSQYSDVKKSGMDPLEHWVKWGYKELFRNPNNTFSNSFYSKHYLRDESEKWNSLTHYLVKGKNYGNKKSIFDSDIHGFDLASINNIMDKLASDISIMVLVTEYSDKFINCIDSLINNTLNSFELIFLDYVGVSEELSNLIELYPNIDAKIISNNDSVDICMFLNNALNQTLNDIVLLNGYSIFSYNWLTNLIIKAYSDENINFVSPLSNFVLETNHHKNDNLFNLTVEGINHILKKSFQNFHLKSNYGDGLLLYIKNNVNNNLIFNRNLFKHDISSNMLFINFKTNQNHVFADSTYVEHDSFRDNFFKCSKFELHLCENDLKLINNHLNEVIQYTTYKSLANRILFVTDDLTRNWLILNKIKYSYNCYFLVNTGKMIMLYDDSSLINSWDLTDNIDIIQDDLLKNIYFNILVSLNIDIVQIDNFYNNSFDLPNICDLLNISLVINCVDECFINQSKHSLIDKKQFFNLSKSLLTNHCLVFTNNDLKNSYLNYFHDLGKFMVIYDENIYNFQNLIERRLKNVVKFCVLGYDDLINYCQDDSLEFHFFKDLSLNFDNVGINHGNFSLNKLKDISPDFILILSKFNELFEIIDYSQLENVPILIIDNVELKSFFDEFPGICYLEYNSSVNFIKLLLDFSSVDKYQELLYELFESNKFLNKKLLFILQDYYKIYLKNEINTKIITSESIFKKENKDYHNFSNIQEFLANSYVSPIINAPFTEEDKRCFAVMDNISKFLMEYVDKNKNNPLVSVIMPVYNRVDTVLLSINSVLNQLYHNIELIIVDDGSTDGTKDLLFDLQDNRINLFFHKYNKGSSSARNTALKNAKGDIIMYLDSDNLWDERYVKTMVGAFIKLPNANALYSGQLLYNNSIHPFSIRFGSFNKSLLKNKNYIDINCFSHKKDVLKRINGFDEDLNRLIDWDFILRIMYNFKIYSVPVLLSNYYLNAKNRITNSSLGNIGINYSNENYVHYIKNKNFVSDNFNFELSHKITIIIPNYGSLYSLRMCVKNIFSLNLNDNIKIIIVNNNSDAALMYYLSIISNHDNVFIINNDIVHTFAYSINQGIVLCDNDSDVIILNSDAFLEEDSIEIMQNAAYNLKECGIVVPQQISYGDSILNHVPYANPIFECDINVSKKYKNIINFPIFHDGDILELNFAPYFCLYIKHDILSLLEDYFVDFIKYDFSDGILSDVVRNVLNLKIYHISDAKVYRI